MYHMGVDILCLGSFMKISGYHIYDVSLHRLLEILNEVRELMFNSYTYFGYTVGDNFDTLDSDIHKLGVVVNCCEIVIIKKR